MPPCRDYIISCQGLSRLRRAWRLRSVIPRHNVRSRQQSMEWLMQPIPLETEIEIEQEARRLKDHPEAGELGAMMVRHAYKLQHLLTCAVHEIARLEAERID